MALKTDYKDDVFEGSRKYKLTEDSSGNTEIEDVTTYSQTGDMFGAKEVNEICGAVNRLNHTVEAAFFASNWSVSAPYTQEVTVSDMTEEDSPLPLFVDDGTDEANSKAKKKAYGFVTYFDSGEGKVTATCKYKKPVTDFTVDFKGV